jgi:hypothetical protein
MFTMILLFCGNVEHLNEVRGDVIPIQALFHANPKAHWVRCNDEHMSEVTSRYREPANGWTLCYLEGSNLISRRYLARARAPWRDRPGVEWYPGVWHTVGESEGATRLLARDMISCGIPRPLVRLLIGR